MTYQELKKVYTKYIDVPHKQESSNSIDVALNIGLTVKNSIGCRQDFKDQYPLYKCNAAYTLFNGEYTIYYNEKYAYRNFSIAHEVAHHLLEHCSDGVREHHDANLLAAIIVTPNISSNKIKSATVLSENYLIPYSVACEYFAELKDEQRTNKNHLRHWLFSIIP